MDSDGDDDEEEGGEEEGDEEEGDDCHYQKSLPSTDYNYCSWCYIKHVYIYTVNLTQRLAMQRYEGLLMSTNVTLTVTATMTMSTVGMKMTM